MEAVAKKLNRHGEVFVLDDGGEVKLNRENFLDISLIDSG